jgi:hypothetical protein
VPHRAGDEETALKSVYNLFELPHTVIKSRSATSAAQVMGPRSIGSNNNSGGKVVLMTRMNK